MITAEATNKIAESSIGDFIVLTKPSVTLLVVLSCITGMILAPAHINPVIAVIAVIATSLASASSAVFNMWYDIDIDSMMKRTQTRPLVRKVINAEDAIVFSFILGVLALALMAACVNYQSSFLLFFSMMFYCLIYTVWLKRRTDLNIVIGGAAGSFPPIIGWISTGAPLTIEPFILFALIFFWTPPHFWALAIHRSKEYELCNVPMLPVTRGFAHTKTQILAYTFVTVLTSLLPVFIGASGAIYFITALLFGARFLHLAYLLKKEEGSTLSIKLFLFSITYLFSLLISLIIDHYAYIAIT